MNMKHFKNITNQDIVKAAGHIEILETDKKGNSYEFNDLLLIPMGFDIETTADDDNEAAFMYIWQFAINDLVIYGRTWEEFIQLNYKIIDALKLETMNNKVYIFVHNLKYEWQFMRKYISEKFNVSKSFFMDNREPGAIKLIKNENIVIEYRDSLLLSQCSLAETAENYCKTKKLPDFDYKVKRTHETKLSDRELLYCANDVIILTEYYRYIIDNIVKTRGYFPLTATQLPRKDVKRRWQVWKMGKNNPNKQFVKKLFPRSYDIYKNDMNYLFRGGYTHANVENSDITINKPIIHVDFTSSYPAVLLHDYYPISSFRETEFKEEYLDNYCCKLKVKFTNIKAKTSITYDSISKAIDLSDDCLDDNGRLYEASSFTVLLTELDLKIYKEIYNWDNMEVLKCKIADKGLLPEYITDVVIEYYTNKAKIKKYGDPKDKDKIAYIDSKKLLNSLYGMMCTKQNIYELSYEDDNYILNEKNLYDYKEWLKIKESQFLSPYWGIWCTAHARYNLFDLIIKLVNKNLTYLYIYSDTDSHFTLEHEFITEYINNWNDNIRKMNEKYDVLLEDIGEFDIENSATKNRIYRFKTLGAKRYLMDYQNDKKNKRLIEATIAGLPKETKIEGVTYNTIEYDANIKGLDPFDDFSNDMVIDQIISNKKCSKYVDHEVISYINGVKEVSKSSIYLHEVDFTLMLTDAYIGLIQSIKEKRIYG